MIKISLLYALLLPVMVQSQYRVSVVEVNRTITTMADGDLGQIIYGTASGEIGYFDGLLLTQQHQVSGGVNLLTKEANGYLASTKVGLYEVSDQMAAISGHHLDVLATDRLDYLFTSKGVFEKQGADYVASNPSGLPVRGSIAKAKLLRTRQGEFLFLDGSLYKKELRWKVVMDSLLDVSITNRDVVMASRDKVFTVEQELYEGPLDANVQIFATSDDRIFLTNDNYIGELVDGELHPVYSINSDSVSSIHEDRWHNIWVATPGFLHRISRTEELQLPSLSTITVNGRDTKSIMLEDDRLLSGTFEGYHLTAPNALMFQSRLVGLTEWSVPSRDMRLQYQEIPEGSYQLEVRGSIDGVNYRYTDPIEISVGSQLLDKVWWLAMICALLIVLAALIVNVRLNNYKKEVERVRQKLTAQNKLLTLEQKALQLQMNPHFIFNALNSIKGQIAKGDSKEARVSLTKFSQLMRATLDMSRGDTTTINQEVDYLSQYLALERWVNEGMFDYTITVTDEVDGERYIPSMLVQPFVENAVKHAFRDMGESGIIKVLFDQVGRSLQISIIDNGVGVQNSEAKKAHKSLGVKVARERLALRYPAAKEALLTIRQGDGARGTVVSIVIPD